jgi:hypothetical protein
MTITPFADDDASTSIGTLTVENGTDRLALYGSLNITRDQQGLAHAKALRDLLDKAVHVLEADKALPHTIAAPEKPKTMKNPFA